MWSLAHLGFLMEGSYLLVNMVSLTYILELYLLEFLGYPGQFMFSTVDRLNSGRSFLLLHLQSIQFPRLLVYLPWPRLLWVASCR